MTTAPTPDQSIDLFDYRHRFQDDVHGRVLLNTLERDVVDTPEFQRLFRISQLAFVRLVFRTAEHTRGVHSLGTCHTAHLLMDHLEHNHRVTRNPSLRSAGNPIPNGFPRSERVLVRLGALLHDISHGPCSHDIETKKHLLRPDMPHLPKVRSFYGSYPKHDSYKDNPALFVLLFDTHVSVLARVLQMYSDPYWRLMVSDTESTQTAQLPDTSLAARLASFVKLARELWCVDKHSPPALLLPQLLFHLLAFEDPATDPADFHVSTSFDTSGNAAPARLWTLGHSPANPEAARALHEAWYQPFRHDIIGNTLSADLLDYLRRDCRHLGLDQSPELNLLTYYVLTPDGRGAGGQGRYRTAIDITDHKRGTIRNDALNDIFRLLELRHEIHEKAVSHRMVHTATAMLGRALLLLGEKARPPLKELYFPARTGSPALAGDDYFFNILLEHSNSPPTASHSAAHDLVTKVIERRLYRPLVVIPGDRIQLLTSGAHEGNQYAASPELQSRCLAGLVDSRYYAPVFLLLSEAIEALLQHVFEPASLRTHLRAIQSRHLKFDHLLYHASHRVIIATHPYKQLYKDPALTVLAGSAETIRLDQFPQGEQATNSSVVKSLRKRCDRALAAADDRYACMWNIYLFLSDGLFASGAIARSSSIHRCAPGTNADTNERHHHCHCLEHAKLLFAHGLRAVYAHWQDTVASQPDWSRLCTLLESSVASPEVVRSVVNLMLNQYEADQDLPWHAKDFAQRISAVATDLYVHCDLPDDDRVFRACRDIRYRSESHISLGSVLKGNGDSSEKELAADLICLGAVDDLLSVGEFNWLAKRRREENRTTACSRLAKQAMSTSQRAGLYDKHSLLTRYLSVLCCGGTLFEAGGWLETGVADE